MKKTTKIKIWMARYTRQYIRNRYKPTNRVVELKFKSSSANTRHPKKSGICSCCGCKNKTTQWHHPDYKKPRLIIELCIKCHFGLHKIINATYYASVKMSEKETKKHLLYLIKFIYKGYSL